MRSASHIVGGLGLSLGFAFHSIEPAFVIAALIGSKAPDFLEFPISVLRSIRLGVVPHRTITHWIIPWAGGGAWLLFQESGFVVYAMLGFCMGGVVHLIQDACTPMGIPLLHPFHKGVSLYLVHGWLSELFVNMALIPLFFMMGYMAALSL